MKRLSNNLLLLLALVVSFLVGCTRDEQQEPKASFKAKTTSVSIPAAGYKSSSPGVYEFSTAQSWTASTPQNVKSWFSFSPTKGNAGDAKIKFTASKNASGTSRTAKMTLITGTTVKEITFTQPYSSDPDPDPDPTPTPTPDTPLYDDVPSGFQEEAESSDADPSGTADLSVFKDMGHPRLLMNRRDFETLKLKVTTYSGNNRNLTQLHNVMIKTANASAKATESITYLTDGNSQDEAKKAMKRIGSCAYAYRMTGEEKYLTRAVADLETIVGFPDWNASDKFLTTAQMAAAAALGYDWLYYSLDYSLRVKIREKLLNYAIIPGRTADFTSAEHNWNQVCYGGTLLGAIAIYGKEKTQSGALINECIANNGRILKKIYEPDGVYPEGYSYWGFGTGFQAFIFVALEKVFGKLYGMDSCEALKKTPYWLLMSSGVNGRVYAFGDSTGMYDQPKMGMWWFAMHYNNPSLLRVELKLLNNTSGETNPYSEKMSEVRMLPVALACANNIDGLDSVSNSSGEKPTMYYASGDIPIVISRTTWDNSDSDRYLAIKGGKANHSHGHMDAGSFSYDALGCRWSQELNRQDYEIYESHGDYWNLSQGSFRWTIFPINNHGHSTLTINDADHNVYGAATVLETYDTESSRGAKLDLSPVFSDQAASVTRKAEIRNGTDLYITDEITALSSKAADIQWRMVTPATVTVGSDMETLTQNGRTIYLKVKVQSGSATPVFTSWPSHGLDWEKTYQGAVAGYTATVSKGSTVTFLTVLTADKDLVL